eukprot:gene19631-biopygen21913
MLLPTSTPPDTPICCSRHLLLPTPQYAPPDICSSRHLNMLLPTSAPPDTSSDHGLCISGAGGRKVIMGCASVAPGGCKVIAANSSTAAAPPAAYMAHTRAPPRCRGATG